MKQFFSLNEAFSHQNDCPFCHAIITRGYASITMNGGETLVEFSIGKSTMIFDYNSGDLREYRQNNSLQEVTTHSYPVYASNGSAHSLSNAGKQLFGVYCSCNQCGQYGYTLQLHVEMGPNKIVGIFLNSETLSFEKNDFLYEIRNVYSSDKTEYKVFNNDKGSETKTLTLPLIPMDLSNPDKTLERIKTLAIFS